MNQKLLLPIICLITLSLQAQNTAEIKPRPWTIGINVGAVRTGLWNQPLASPPCFEGCAIYAQTPLWTPSYNLDVRYDLNRSNAIVLGVGVSYLRYHQTGYYSDGANNHDYERDYQYGFFNVQLGHRYRFLLREKSQWFFDNRAMMDMNLLQNEPETSALKNYAFSYIGRAGFQWNVAGRNAFTVNAMFRTALATYTPQLVDTWSPPEPNDMFPFGYGLECGWTFRL